MNRMIGMLTVLGLVSSGCDAEPAVRTVTLNPEPEMIPTGAVAVVGGEVRAEFTEVESLEDGLRYVLWADTPSDTVALGQIEPGKPLAVLAADLGFEVEDLVSVFVSVEGDGSGLPSSPSLTTVVQGAVPGVLRFGGSVDAESFEHASGTATLEDNSIHVSSAGLPALPNGFHYEVWLGFGAAHDEGGEGDAHAESKFDVASAGHDEPPALEGFVSMGELDGELMRTHSNSLVVAAECQVTIEADDGHGEMSDTRVLRGMVMTQSDAPAGGADEEEGPEHLH